RHLEPAHVREAEIELDDVRPPIAGHLDALGARGGVHDVLAVALEGEAHELADGRVVFDDQNPHRPSPPRGRHGRVFRARRLPNLQIPLRLYRPLRPEDKLKEGKTPYYLDLPGRCPCVGPLREV